jgi:hypothetical protein
LSDFAGGFAARGLEEGRGSLCDGLRLGIHGSWELKVNV